MPVLVATIWAMEVDSSEMMVTTKTNKPKGRPTSSADRKHPCWAYSSYSNSFASESPVMPLRVAARGHLLGCLCPPPMTSKY